MLLGIIKLKDIEIIRSSFGSKVRDLILKIFVGKFYQYLGNEPILARLDAYEFVFSAYIRDVFLLEKIHNFAREITNPFTIKEGSFQIGINIGIARYPEDACDLSSLFHAADLALSSAMQSKDRKVICYQKKLSESFLQHIALINELPTALETNQFQVLYQPQVEAVSDRIIGAEALVRWNHPSMGVISPVTFIPMTEENCFIVKLGEWILKKACKDALNWKENQKVSVNVSAVQLLDSRRFIQNIKNILNSTGLIPERLILEITESVMFEREEEILEVLTELKSMGISIALDDFGTGYSSLAYVHKLSLDELKIDQSFIKPLGVDPDSEHIIKIIIELSKYLGLRSIAEGVETKKQADLLREIGCDWFQGYLYGKPMSQDDFCKMIYEKP
jgi:predicted signal transduction protein with EAL and GGDEF domain